MRYDTSKKTTRAHKMWWLISEGVVFIIMDPVIYICICLALNMLYKGPLTKLHCNLSH